MLSWAPLTSLNGRECSCKCKYCEVASQSQDAAAVSAGPGKADRPWFDLTKVWRDQTKDLPVEDMFNKVKNILKAQKYLSLPKVSSAGDHTAAAISCIQGSYLTFIMLTLTFMTWNFYDVLSVTT